MGDATATVKFYNKDRGYGFLTPTHGGDDVFFHVSTLEACGLRPEAMNEGQRVSYKLGEQRGKTAAVEVRVA